MYAKLLELARAELDKGKHWSEIETDVISQLHAAVMAAKSMRECEKILKEAKR